MGALTDLKVLPVAGALGGGLHDSEVVVAQEAAGGHGPERHDALPHMHNLGPGIFMGSDVKVQRHYLNLAIV